MQEIDLPQLEDFKGTVQVPYPSMSAQETLGRWSNLGVSQLPALIAIPKSESDILTLITYARDHGLQILPRGGGHSTFAPITPKTLYLDMKEFDQITLDESSNSVTVGGGVVTGQLVEACTTRGFYTTWVNSNAVGVVGSVLGGGNQALSGLHGLMIDNVLGARILTADGRALDVNPTSFTELFYGICGAGHGLGIITRLTLRVFPIAGLAMDGDKFWVRKLIFPPDAIDFASSIYQELLPPSPASSVVLTFVRSPPQSPTPGTPLIILTTTHFGPPDVGRREAEVLFRDDVEARAVVSETIFMPFAKMNDQFEPFNGHGDFKDIQSEWIKRTPPEAIQASFKVWLDFTESHGDGMRSVFVLSTTSIENHCNILNTAEGKSRYFDCRDRTSQVLIVRWFTEDETAIAASRFVEQLKQSFLCHQRVSDPRRTIANNMTPEMDMLQVFSPDNIDRIKGLKDEWDPAARFWSPYGKT